MRHRAAQRGAENIAYGRAGISEFSIEEAARRSPSLVALAHEVFEEAMHGGRQIELMSFTTRVERLKHEYGPFPALR